MSVPSRDPASIRLAEIAASIAVESGPAALTARALAGAAEASPSAVNYHFGGRDGLLLEVHRGLRQRRAAWRAMRLSEVVAGGAVWPTLLSAIFDLAVIRRGETPALLEFEALAGAVAPELGESVRAEHRDQVAFWQAMAGGPPTAAHVWSCFALSAVRFALLDEGAAALTWLAPSLLRLAERMEGRATPAATPWLADAQPPGSLPARPAGAQRLLAAALEIIGRQGLHAVTLRSVAEAAGLSLASTTYFFATKAEIVLAAFAQLRDGVSVAALSGGMEGTSGFTRVLLSPKGEMRWEIGAMHALFLAGARNRDLRDVALGLRRLSGQTSAAWLARHAGAPTDRLDAFVWSTFGMGTQEALSHLPAVERREAMERSTSLAGQAIFGMAPSSVG